MRNNKNCRIRWTAWISCLAAMMFFGFSQIATAASCTVGSSGVSSFGVEMFATHDYGDGTYDYDVNLVQCSGGQVISWLYSSTYASTPAAATQQNRGLNLSRAFMNTCGSHITLIHDNFNGTISGISLTTTAYPKSANYPDIFGNSLIGNLPPLPCLCASGQARNGLGVCIPTAEGKQIGQPQSCQEKQSQPTTSYPISIGSGYKYWQETVFAEGGEGSLSYRLSYTSRKTTDQYKPTYSHGANWLNGYEAKLILEANGTTTTGPSAVYPQRPNGRLLAFRLSGSNYVPEADISDKLVRLTNASGGTTGWTLADAVTQTTETYDAAGKLQSLTDRNGLTRTLAYDTSGRLSTITDAFGRALTLGYDTSNRVSTLTQPDTGVVHFGYDANNNLNTITWPDTKVKQFLYENATFKNSLTGITDENNSRFATYGYNTSGQASSETLAGGADAATINIGATSTTVTDALLTARTYNFSTVLGVPRTTGSSQPAGSGCAASSSALTYDANGNIATRTDFNSNLTQYTYDLTRNLETKRVEGLTSAGVATAATRTISTQWHPDWRLASRIAEPLKITTLVYNGQPDPTNANAVLTCAPTTALVNGKPLAVLCKKVEQATTDATGAAAFTATAATGAQSTRTWSYTYNAYGQVLTVDGPRTDVIDTTTYTWYPLTDPTPAKRGNLATMTDALGHIWNYTSYDANGRVLSMTDPNGTVIAYSYTPRGWLSTRTVAGDLTTFNYDFAGQLSSITFPDNSSVIYTYDAAHRLTDIYDATGHHIHYTLDAAGNRTKEEYLNADGSVARELNRTFDALSRLQNEINGPVTQAGSTYGYFANGELKTSATPKNDTTTLEIDALGRTTKRIDPLNGTTKPTLLGYDAQDRLVSYTAPNGAATGYTVDGLGNTLQEVSADRGTSNAGYDAAGNRLTWQDARNVTISAQYDALNRPTRIDTPAVGSQPASSITYIWDTAAGCTHGVGHLCQITDAAGSTIFDYDASGNRITETRSEGGESFTTHYAYNAANRLTDTITPTAESIVATLDMSGKVQGLSATGAGNVTTAIAQNISYNANGQILSELLGLSQFSQAFDAAGRVSNAIGIDTTAAPPSDVDTPIPGWALALLGAGLLFGMQRYRRSPHLMRALGFMLVTGLGIGMMQPHDAQAVDIGFTYDANGNVSSKTTPAGTTNYTFDALDRIGTESGPTGNRTHTYDPNDNRTSDGAGNSDTLSPNSDRLATINGIAVTLDASGNLTSDGSYQYVWDAYGQLKEVHRADNTLLATYYYDYRGLRTRKVTTAAAPQGASTTFYHYNPQSHLIAETAPGQIPLVTYVWNEDTVTGIIEHQPTRTVYTVQTDQIGSPFQVRTLAGKVIWRWEPEAYGATYPNEDPDGDKIKFVLNLRYPGQYYDQESGLHYNWHRYYSPKLARYLTPDPIGLGGGGNMYAYVGGNPLKYTDPNGLLFIDPTGTIPDDISGPKNPSKECAANDKDKCIEISTKGVCQFGDVMCAVGMQSAGIAPPYYPETKKYSLKCILALGLLKVPAGAAENAAAARAGGIIGYAMNSPAVNAIGAGYALDKVMKECECHGKQ